MVSTAVSTFGEQVIASFRLSVPGRSAPLDYASYLQLPAVQRTGDEAAAVDAVFTVSVLRWLGFDVASGEEVYNRTRVGTATTRPDYVVRGPATVAFTWEDKATSEEYSPEHLDQLRKYMAGQSGYAVWCNARRILALRFDADGRAETIADVSVEALFGPQAGTGEERQRHETALQLFHVLFERPRFFAFDKLLANVTSDEAAFLAHALPVDSDAAQRQFIDGSRTVLESLRLAALTRIQSAAVSAQRRHHQDAALTAEWSAAAQELEALLAVDLRPSVTEQLAGLEPRLGALHNDDLLGVERAAAAARGGTLPPSQRQLFLLWGERARRINSAARGVRQAGSDLDALHEAYLNWRERQPDVRLATAEVYAEQVGYVFFVRLLLARVLEDKGLLPSRIASDGGFKAGIDLVSLYFGPQRHELHSHSFLRLLSERVSSYYQHFFRQPFFDWFIPDDYLLLVTLDFLSQYSFAALSSDLLGFTYEEYIDRVARGRKGHFLTRPPVVEYMLDILGYAGPQVIGRRLIDPASGSGSFLVHAARRLRTALIERLAAQHRVSEQSLLATPLYRQDLARQYIETVTASFVGMDIDPFACYLAELNLLIQCLDDLHVLWSVNDFVPIESFRIFNTDSLDIPEPTRNLSLTGAQAVISGFSAPMSGALLDPSYGVKVREGEYRQGFFYVICNPPYVNARQESIPTDYRRIPFFAEALAGDTNLYLLFIKLGLHYLSSSGRMAFIVPLTVFGDDSSSAVRGLLTQQMVHPDYLVRFYTGNVLFPGVDQAVAIFQVESETEAPAEMTITGGRNVGEARQASVQVARNRVVAAVPRDPGWNRAWLVSPDPSAYGVWEAVRAVASGKLATLWEPLFDVAQGDVNATYLNPMRVDTPAPGDVAVYKGENVYRFAPLPTPPSDWARPRPVSGLSSTGRRANQVIARLAGLTEPEEGFALREVARLNTRDQLMATWFKRELSHPLAFTHELWRFAKRPGADAVRSRAIFGVVASGVAYYLLNLFSTNNHVAITQLGRLLIPNLDQFDTMLIGSIVDDLLSTRQHIQLAFMPLGGKFPDMDGILSISPDAVLRESRLPSVTLATLALRGDVSFTGTAGTRLGNVLPRYLTVTEGSPLAQALPLFLEAHAQARWGDMAARLHIPEPNVTTSWLTRFRQLHDELEQRWAEFRRLERDLDTAIEDWYGFTSGQRAAIARGLPWVMAAPPVPLAPEP